VQTYFFREDLLGILFSAFKEGLDDHPVIKRKHNN
jgi:hypothetical protein